MKSFEQIAQAMHDKWQKAMLRFRKPKPFYELEEHERKAWIAAAKATGCEDSGQGYTYHHPNVEAKTHDEPGKQQATSRIAGKYTCECGKFELLEPEQIEKIPGQKDDAL